MKLLLDLGNSRLKWALSGPGTWRSGVAVGSVEDYLNALSTLPVAAKDIDEVWLSSVRPGQLQEALLHGLKQRFQSHCQLALTPAEQDGLRNAYPAPSSLGVDRWLAMLGAWQFGRPVLVADCGTAMTLDAVSHDGQHQGGLIVPGAETMIESLRLRAPHLPPALQNPEAGLARDTATALDNGARLACAALIERVLQQCVDADPVIRLVITGGGAPTLIPLLRCAVDHRSDLVLLGLLRYSQSAGRT